MAQGNCKRRTVKFAKAAARFLGPALGGLIPQVVAGLEAVRDVDGLELDGHKRRRAVISTVVTKAQEIGHAAYDPARDRLTSEAEGYVRAAIEAALHNLRSGVKLDRLQDWASDEDLQDDPDENTEAAP